MDDNDRYADALTDDLKDRGVEEIVRALTAREGVSIIHSHGDDFDGVISDISMESQISGLNVLRVARRHPGKLMVACATTGLDTPVGYWFNKFLLGTLFRCDYLIPKRPIKRDGKVFWIRGANVWIENQL
ncbi:hypothetical protein BMS3Bbin04_00165 [bacterium BMS3Bbin04]|nr:hypothetical protein BMS3Bbin04_00165 [bacterium BMS3Bbin04]